MQSICGTLRYLFFRPLNIAGGGICGTLRYLFFRPLSSFCSGWGPDYLCSAVYIPPQTELQLLVHEVDIADTPPASCNTCPVTYTVLPRVKEVPISS